MTIRLKSQNDVRMFVLVVSFVVLLASIALRYLLHSPALFHQTLLPGSGMALMLAAPIAYFVGQQMLDVYLLTVRLEQAANRDTLTGTCTRASFYKRLEGLGPGPKAVVLTDIDHFKMINDRHGHHVGDRALTLFARTLVRNCREEDIVARFGGEEFVILLEEASLDDGRVTAERLCRRVREKIHLIDGVKVPVTASFGVADLTGDTAGIDAAMRCADRALYRAKAGGRDRVCVHDDALDGDAAEAPPQPCAGVRSVP